MEKEKEKGMEMEMVMVIARIEPESSLLGELQ